MVHGSLALNTPLHPSKHYTDSNFMIKITKQLFGMQEYNYNLKNHNLII